MRSSIPHRVAIALSLLLARPCLAGEPLLEPDAELPCNHLCRAWLGVQEAPSPAPRPTVALPAANPTAPRTEVHAGPAKRPAGKRHIATNPRRVNTTAQSSSASAAGGLAHRQTAARPGTHALQALEAERRSPLQPDPVDHLPPAEIRAANSARIQSVAPSSEAAPSPAFMLSRAYEPAPQVEGEAAAPAVAPPVDNDQTESMRVAPEAQAPPRPEEPNDAANAMPEHTETTAPADAPLAVAATGANEAQPPAADAPTGSKGDASVPPPMVYRADTSAMADALATSVRFLPWDAVGTLLLERTPMSLQ